MNGRHRDLQGCQHLLHTHMRSDLEYYHHYNLAADPSEKYNLLDKYPEKVAELKEIMVREHIEDPNWPLLKK